MKKFIVVLSLVICAVDVSGNVYACFGFDMAACQSFIHQFRGPYGPLQCWIR